MAATNKTQPTLTDAATAATPHDNEVKIENISPDTSPLHQSTNKPTNTLVLDKTLTKTKQHRTAGSDTLTVENLQGTQNTGREGSNRVKDRISHKPPKKDTEPPATAKTSIKTVPLQKDKPKEPTGYAARYFQKRAAEHSTKPKEKEMIDIDRPLLSPATRESMARKRRCSDKPITDESLANSQNNNVTSISAPVRRTKPSTLGSGENVL